MNLFITGVTVLALMGSALVGGIFFGFSSFIMGALARLPSREGIAAMQSINIVVINRSFLGIFFGTALISLLTGFLAITQWSAAGSPWLLAGGLFYLLGTFLLTVFGNVPLNKGLAALNPTESAANQVWDHYLARWTMLNTIRSACALASALCSVTGLLQTGN